ERDDAAVRALWQRLADDGRFDFRATPWWPAVLASGIVSGSSSHAGRLATIREVHQRYGIIVDPHTADGLHVGMRLRDAAVPLVAIETALPAKFGPTIEEALSIAAPRPAAYAGLEQRAQHFTPLPADVEAVRAYVALHAIGA
ncbi:MAG: threonine synthase, partial [Casimicrobiaceae bacterium]